MQERRPVDRALVGFIAAAIALCFKLVALRLFRLVHGSGAPALWRRWGPALSRAQPEAAVPALSAALAIRMATAGDEGGPAAGAPPRRKSTGGTSLAAIDARPSRASSSRSLASGKRRSGGAAGSFHLTPPRRNNTAVAFLEAPDIGSSMRGRRRRGNGSGKGTVYGHDDASSRLVGGSIEPRSSSPGGLPDSMWGRLKTFALGDTSPGSDRSGLKFHPLVPRESSGVAESSRQPRPSGSRAGSAFDPSASSRSLKAAAAPAARGKRREPSSASSGSAAGLPSQSSHGWWRSLPLGEGSLMPGRGGPANTGTVDSSPRPRPPRADASFSIMAGRPRISYAGRLTDSSVRETSSSGGSGGGGGSKRPPARRSSSKGSLFAASPREQPAVAASAADAASAAAAGEVAAGAPPPERADGASAGLRRSSQSGQSAPQLLSALSAVSEGGEGVEADAADGPQRDDDGGWWSPASGGFSPTALPSIAVLAKVEEADEHESMTPTCAATAAGPRRVNSPLHPSSDGGESTPRRRARKALAVSGDGKTFSLVAASDAAGAAAGARQRVSAGGPAPPAKRASAGRLSKKPPVKSATGPMYSASAAASASAKAAARDASQAAAADGASGGRAVPVRRSSLKTPSRRFSTSAEVAAGAGAPQPQPQPPKRMSSFGSRPQPPVRRASFARNVVAVAPHEDGDSENLASPSPSGRRPRRSSFKIAPLPTDGGASATPAAQGPSPSPAPPRRSASSTGDVALSPRSRSAPRHAASSGSLAALARGSVSSPRLSRSGAASGPRQPGRVSASGSDAGTVGRRSSRRSLGGGSRNRLAPSAAASGASSAARNVLLGRARAQRAAAAARALRSPWVARGGWLRAPRHVRGETPRRIQEVFADNLRTPWLPRIILLVRCARRF